MNLAWHTRGAATAYRSRRLMELRGVTPNGHPLWNGQEVGDLVADVRNYPLAMLNLPRRTLPAARSKASRLGIARPKAREWDENEIPRLRRIYPNGTRAEIEAAFPGRSYSAIGKAANARGIHRARKPYKPSGITLIDQILVRAVFERWTLAAIDKETHWPGYFSQRKWKVRRQVIAESRAVKLLGGHLRARFAVLNQR